MNSIVHIPVMSAEVAELLLENGGTRYLDCTLGGGGHLNALLEAANRPIELIGIDIDNDALRSCERRFGDRKNVTIARGDYGRLEATAHNLGLSELDGILADFGQSSDQIDRAERGMSFQSDAPLDMRYDTSRGETAAEFLNRVEYPELLSLLREIGQEHQAAKIVREIVRQRPLRTTEDLSRTIRKAAHPEFINKTLSRIFMAIRVYVNDELNAIERFLPDALKLLRPSGRLVCLSYDSNQDTRVKRFFRERQNPCICPPRLPVCLCGRTPELHIITPRALKSTLAEQSANPRSRSARLRAAEKL